MDEDETNSCEEILGFLNDLHENKIKYCHWKSNDCLERSLSGENDLDILVSKYDGNKIRSIIFDRGYKFVRGNGRLDLPGIEDYYGYDHDSGIVFHIHVHFQLIVGHDSVKNVRLPIEENYIASADFKFNSIIKTPEPEVELIVLVVRIILKYTIYGHIRRGAGCSGALRNELLILKERCSSDSLERVAQEFNFIGIDVVSKVIELVDNGNIRQWAYLSMIMNYRLLQLSRLSWLGALVKKFNYRLRIFFRLVQPKRRLFYGGRLIAFIGSDGAGKSTQIRKLCEWLEDVCEVRSFHMGKPERGVGTRIVNLLIKTAGWLRVHKDQDSLLYILSEYFYSLDRVHAINKAYRKTIKGNIVLADRFPNSCLKEVDGPYYPSEGSKFKLGDGKVVLSFVEKMSMAFIDGQISKFESIPNPDVFIYLRVDENVAVNRKADEPEEYVRQRNRIVSRSIEGIGSVIEVDSNLPEEDVLKSLKKVVWETL